MPSSDISPITVLMQPIKVMDEFGKVGMLVSMDSTRQNPFQLKSLESSGAHWYCRNITAL
ncbi:hypothetical protein REH81_35175 [Vibrio rotiferianus]